MDMINYQDIDIGPHLHHSRDTGASLLDQPISLSPSSSNLDILVWIITATTECKVEQSPEEPNPEEPNEMTPKKTSTSAAPPMTQAAIKKLVADSVAIALEAQAAIMANTDNTNRNTRQRETPIERKCSYKEFMNCQPFNFKGTEGAVGLIHWFKRTELVFLRSNYTKDCKVKFATGTLTEEAYPSGIHSPNLLE
ncbi:hypothetical protein Tco_0563448 [Tanacetum coccineum]